MEYVRYIDKTRDYYLKQGFTKTYAWAHHDSAPFTPLRKPLAESRVMLISTAGFTLAPEGGFSEAEVRELKRQGGSNVGSYDLEVFPVPSDLPEARICYVAGNHDRGQSDMSDPNSFFPIARLREFAAEGVLGSLAKDFLRIKENYSQRKTVNVDAPEVLRRCREDHIDVALLTPV